MSHLSRRAFLAATASAAIVLPRFAAAQGLRTYRVLLNSGISGPQAFMMLAQDRGYLREAGVDVQFVAGDGAAAVVPRVLPEGFDFGYGDITALIELAGRTAGEVPLAVYTVFNVTPLTIVVDANGPIRGPKDLEGKSVIGHPIDAALVMWPVWAAGAGVDASHVKVVKSEASMRANVESVLAGTHAGCFGFVNTIVAAVAPAKVERARLRFFEYKDQLPDLYGNGLMVRPSLARERPEDVRAIVRAFNRGLRDTVADLDAAIESVAKREPTVNKAVDRARLAGTLQMEMSHAEGARIGIGDMDPGRLERGIAQIAKATGATRVPRADQIFSRAFLPPDAERVKNLAR